MGGTIPMLSTHAEKWEDASPRPPPIDARDWDCWSFALTNLLQEASILSLSMN